MEPNNLETSQKGQAGKPVVYLSLSERWEIEGNSPELMDLSDDDAEFELMEDRAVGCLVGLAVGDALGSTVQTEWPTSKVTQARAKGQSEMRVRNSRYLELGETTSITATMLCLAESLVATDSNKLDNNSDESKLFLQGLDVEDFGRRLVGWQRTQPEDVGGTEQLALKRITLGVSGAKSGDANPDNQGSGAVVRTAPVGVLWHQYQNRDKLVRDSLLSAYPTHRSMVASEACVVVNMVISYLIWDRDIEWALGDVLPFVGLEWQGILQEWQLAGKPARKDANNWVVAVVLTALHSVITTQSFEEAVVKAVRSSDGRQDASMVGAIAGAVAGALWGHSEIPERWTTALRDYGRIARLGAWLFALGYSQNV